MRIFTAHWFWENQGYVLSRWDETSLKIFNQFCRIKGMIPNHKDPGLKEEDIIDPNLTLAAESIVPVEEQDDCFTEVDANRLFFIDGSDGWGSKLVVYQDQISWLTIPPK